MIQKENINLMVGGVSNIIKIMQNNYSSDNKESLFSADIYNSLRWTLKEIERPLYYGFGDG